MVLVIFNNSVYKNLYNLIVLLGNDEFKDRVDFFTKMDFYVIYPRVLNRIIQDNIFFVNLTAIFLEKIGQIMGSYTAE